MILISSTAIAQVSEGHSVLAEGTVASTNSILLNFATVISSPAGCFAYLSWDKTHAQHGTVIFPSQPGAKSRIEHTATRRLALVSFSFQPSK